MAPTKPILIAGAGIAGLGLARALRARQIPFEVFERDAAGAARAQGYRIRISAQGQDALRAIFTADEYARFEAGCSDNGGGAIMALDALTLAPKGSGPPPPGSGGGGGGGPGDGPGGGGPPADGKNSAGKVLGVERTFLRDRLLEGLEDAVHYGKRVVGYELTGGSGSASNDGGAGGGVVAKFADGTTSREGAMLVGADGVYSAVTAQLTGGRLKVFDTGARMIHGSSPRAAFAGLPGSSEVAEEDAAADGEEAETTQPKAKAYMLADESGRNGTGGGRLNLITNVRPGAAHLGWVLVGQPGTFSSPGDDDNGKDKDGQTGAPAAELSRALTAHWAAGARRILAEQVEGEAAFLKMSTSSPDGVPEWPAQPRVTLAGDAVHAMTPAGGVGANTALRDAALLASLLGGGEKEKGEGEAAAQAYEREMRRYASENVRSSYEMVKERFAVRKLEKTLT
ncbi:FAD/NAD(P)-binding domain-containing protein [Xylariaceae sp. FL0804]|nr:FAD/NAD(P)-binding domain-containing protein [Xylariaceae sp. FL0804]